MITVHHLNDSRSQRILWLLEELELEYEVKCYQRDPRTLLAPPELKAIHPLGKAPILTDGEVVVAESGAIIDYLAEHYGNGRFIPPRGTPERLRYTHFLHYTEGSMMAPLLLKLVFDRVETSRMPFFIKPVARMIAAKVKRGYVQGQIALHLNYLEAELAHRPWFAGSEFSAADIQLGFALEVAQTRAGLDARYPRLLDFLSRIQARPAYVRAQQRGQYQHIGGPTLK